MRLKGFEDFVGQSSFCIGFKVEGLGEGAGGGSLSLSLPLSRSLSLSRLSLPLFCPELFRLLGDMIRHNLLLRA